MARGGLMGGTRPYLEVVSALFDYVLEDTLRNGYLGTEENILSIIVQNFPELVHQYDNKNKGNCAVFKEFLVPIMVPDLDGYDLRGLQCR